MVSTRGKVHGIGINDSITPTRKYAKGKIVWRCPFFTAWTSMLNRCYGKVSANPTYEGCSVSEEWLKFTTFKAWMETQDWEGNELDKDLLIQGNKVYRPDACIFISAKVNTFLTDSKASRGDYALGVNFEKSRGNYRASGRENGSYFFIGRYSSEKEAHLAYCVHNEGLAKSLADEQDDKLVSQLLIQRFRIMREKAEHGFG